MVEGIWAAYVSLTPTPPVEFCPAGVPCPGPTFSQSGVFVLLMMACAVLLVLDGLLGLWGAWFAYPVGAVVSAALLATTGYAYWSDSAVSYMASWTINELVAAVVSAVGLTTNAVAWRVRSAISEQANPMNLPVFG